MIIHNYATIKSLPSVIVRIGVWKHSLLWRDIVEQTLLLLHLLREESNLRLSILTYWEALAVKLSRIGASSELRNVAMWGRVLRSICIGVWVLHGRSIVWVELSIVQSHHLVVVHRVHVVEITLIMLVPAATVVSVLAIILLTSSIPVAFFSMIMALVVSKFVDSSRWRFFPLVLLIREIPLDSYTFFI